jgi:hypothetical protein
MVGGEEDVGEGPGPAVRRPVSGHRRRARRVSRHRPSGVGGSRVPSVDVAAVPDGFDHHSVIILVDPIDDPVVPAAGAMKAFKLEPKGVPHPVRDLGERPIDELDSGDGDLFR